MIAVIGQRYPGRSKYGNDTPAMRLKWVKQGLERVADLEGLKSLAFPKILDVVPQMNTKKPFLISPHINICIQIEMSTFEDLREVFIRCDPMGLLYLGQEEDIYDRGVRSLAWFLDKTSSTPSLEDLTLHIESIFSALIFGIAPSREECKRVAQCILDRRGPNPQN